MMTKSFLCSSKGPIVQTKAGKIRGFKEDSTYTFHGIKYCDARRFQMPSKVKPWTGVKDALSYGYVCPLLSKPVPFGEVMVPHRYWIENEHCQYLNIWTQTLDEGAKKPVMVWLHGGAFMEGSSIEQQAYDGHNMSACGDVVVVTLNHRINILGYLDLSPFGKKYKNSANAGNADIVAALEWIHENIGAFGGDAENVTIFGQSGGGMKVWSIMNTPSADGLYHKAIIQSGVLDGYDAKPGDGAKIVRAMMDLLNVSDAEALETIPYADLARAYSQAAPVIDKQGFYTGGIPVANEWYAGDPRRVGFLPYARKVPLIIGTVFAEFAFGPGIPDKWNIPKPQLEEMLDKRYGSYKDELLRLFKAAYPDKCPADLLVLDSMFRGPSLDFTLKKAACSKAPVYAYQFAYEFPYDDGKPAWHCSEIPFVFHNTPLVPICCIPGVSDRLEAQMSGAWISFAYTGNPNHEGLPDWPATTPEDEAVMVFDRTGQCRHNFDHELIAMHKLAAPKIELDSEEILH